MLCSRERKARWPSPEGAVSACVLKDNLHRTRTHTVWLLRTQLTLHTLSCSHRTSDDEKLLVEAPAVTSASRSRDTPLCQTLLVRKTQPNHFSPSASHTLLLIIGS